MSKAKDTDIPIWFLIACFILDPTVPSGLRWRERPHEHFANKQVWRAFNTHFAGKPAGTLTDTGYWRVQLKFDGRLRKIRTHRIIKALELGRWPDHDVDHKDQNKAVNKPDNLREATGSQNRQNTSLRCTNSSGVKGVSWDKRRGKWRTQIMADGRYINRSFDSLMDACHARWAAEIACHPFRVQELEPPKPFNIFDRVPSGSMVTGCWSTGDNPHWTVLDYA